MRVTVDVHSAPLVLLATLAAVLAAGLLLSPAPLAAQAEDERRETCEDRANAVQKGLAAAMRELSRSLVELRRSLEDSAERTPRERTPRERRPLPDLPLERAGPQPSWAETCCRDELERTVQTVAALEKETARLSRTCRAFPNPRAAAEPCTAFPRAVEELLNELARLRLAASLAEARDALRSSVRTAGLSLAPWFPEEEAEEHFAPGQFQELEDSEKLSAPGFQELLAGCRLERPAVPARRP